MRQLFRQVRSHASVSLRQSLTWYVVAHAWNRRLQAVSQVRQQASETRTEFECARAVGSSGNPRNHDGHGGGTIPLSPANADDVIRPKMIPTTSDRFIAPSVPSLTAS